MRMRGEVQFPEGNVVCPETIILGRRENDELVIRKVAEQNKSSGKNTTTCVHGLFTSIAYVIVLV